MLDLRMGRYINKVAQWTKSPKVPGVIAVVIMGIIALGFFVLMGVLWRQLQRKRGARPRLVVTVGVVQEMRTVHSLSMGGNKRGHTVVRVDFTVAGVPYVCRELWFFAGNVHGRDVGPLYDFPPGKEVGLYYDTADPKLCAMMVDQPRYFPFIWAGAMGVLFVVLAVHVWRSQG